MPVTVTSIQVSLYYFDFIYYLLTLPYSLHKPVLLINEETLELHREPISLCKMVLCSALLTFFHLPLTTRLYLIFFISNVSTIEDLTLLQFQYSRYGGFFIIHSEWQCNSKICEGDGQLENICVAFGCWYLWLNIEKVKRALGA